MALRMTVMQMALSWTQAWHKKMSPRRGAAFVLLFYCQNAAKSSAPFLVPTPEKAAFNVFFSLT